MASASAWAVCRMPGFGHTHQGDNLKKMAVNQWYDEYGYGQPWYSQQAT